MKTNTKSASLIVLLITACSVSTEDYTSNETSTPSVIQGYRPQVVGPNVISTSAFEGHASITPDGNEIYYAIYSNDHSYSTIAYSKKENGSWRDPQIVSFSGQYSDGSPALSPDGQKLFFSSKRPFNQEKEISTNIWFVERNGDSWGEPKPLSDKVNSSYTEFSPSVDKNGNLFFCSNRPGGYGDMDVYFSAYVDGSYREAILLDSTINSKYHEGNVGVSPDGKMLFIMRQHYPGDYGYDDIHVSIRSSNKWSSAQNIGEVVNTPTYDFSPKVSPDGKQLYFSSRLNIDFIKEDSRYTYRSFQAQLQSPFNGLGNIYIIPIQDLKLHDGN